MRVGFAGSGSVAAAMARGWAAGPGGPEAMAFTDGGSGRAAALAAEVGGSAAAGNRELAEGADLVVLAMKPARLDEVAGQMGGSAPAILSLLGATPIERVEAAFPAVPVIRLMPNVCVEVRRGVLCYAPAPGAPAGLVAEVRALLEPLGRLVALEEALLDPATAIMSCSPAYIALVAESLAEGGAGQGIDPGLARELAVETLAGTAELLRARDPAAVRRAVAPPGGITEAGLAALERDGFRAALAGAIRTTAERMGA